MVTELEQKIKQLETVKNNMDGASYGEVKGALSEIETQLRFQCKSLKELRDGLRSIILAYLKTERKIEDLRMGAHKDLSEDKSTNPGMEGDDEKDNLQEFLEFIKSELNETGNNINKEYEKVNFLFEELFKDPNAFIPQNIRNEGVLLFYEILRQYNGISEKRIEKNALINHELLCESNDILKSGEYIENQSNWGDVQFGLLKEHNMRYSGCGIIATYNALLALGEDASGKTMVDLISSYERDGAVINGEFGTAPGAIEDYFKKNDYDVLMTASKVTGEEQVLLADDKLSRVTVYSDILFYLKDTYLFMCPINRNPYIDSIELNSLIERSGSFAGTLNEEKYFNFDGISVGGHMDLENDYFHIHYVREEQTNYNIFPLSEKSILAGDDKIVFWTESEYEPNFFYKKAGEEEQHIIECLQNKRYSYSNIFENYLMEEQGKIIGLFSVSQHPHRIQSEMELYQGTLENDLIFQLDPKTGESTILYQTRNNRTKIIGYQDGMMYLMKNYKVYSKPIDGGKEKKLFTLPKDKNYIFDWQADYLIVLEDNAVKNQVIVAHKIEFETIIDNYY